MVGGWETWAWRCGSKLSCRRRRAPEASRWNQSQLSLKLPMIFCLRRLAPKLRVVGARYFQNSSPSAGLGMKTTLKPRLGPQDSNSPAVISPPAEQTRPTVGTTAHPETYVAPVKENGEADRGQLHNPYQGIPTAWQVAYESCFFPTPHRRPAAYRRIHTARRAHRPISHPMYPIADTNNSRPLDLDSQPSRQTSEQQKLRPSGSPIEGTSREGAAGLGKNHS